MAIKSKRSTILHVEDDPILANLARMSLKRLGFQGELLHAARVAEALEILSARAQEKAPLDLILLDMQLPDGRGLDVLRRVKASPAWNRLPVIFLSGETDPKIINETYALGANCYLPKISLGKEGLSSFKALYECWIEGALTPAAEFIDEKDESLGKGVLFRNRTARFYLGLAKHRNNTPEMESFWLERALIEGNMANLLTFLQEQPISQKMPNELTMRTAVMQANVESALDAAEDLLARQPSPGQEDIWRCVLNLLDAWDKEVIIAGFDMLFPNSPIIIKALKTRALNQIKALAELVIVRSADQESCVRAKSLFEFAECDRY